MAREENKKNTPVELGWSGKLGEVGKGQEQKGNEDLVFVRKITERQLQGRIENSGRIIVLCLYLHHFYRQQQQTDSCDYDDAPQGDEYDDG